MPQLHFYVDKETEAELKERANASGETLSRYLAHIIKKDIGQQWPAGYLDAVVGQWQGEPFVRPSQGEFEDRDSWNS